MIRSAARGNVWPHFVPWYSRPICKKKLLVCGLGKPNSPADSASRPEGCPFRSALPLLSLSVWLRASAFRCDAGAFIPGGQHQNALVSGIVQAKAGADCLLLVTLTADESWAKALQRFRFHRRRDNPGLLGDQWIGC